MRYAIVSLFAVAMCIGCTGETPADRCVLEKPPAEWLYDQQSKTNSCQE